VKNILLFLIFTVIGGVATFLYFTKIPRQNFPKNETGPTPTSLSPTYSLDKAPSETIIGQVLVASGDVKWQGRTATEAAELIMPKNLQQGESIATGNDGKTNIQFNETIINILPNTQINIIQTLPVNFVMEQNSGSAEYSNNGTNPLTVRSQKLILDLGSGRISIAVNEKISTVTVKVINGNVTCAFNGSTGATNVKTINEKYQFVFNYKYKRGTIRRM
jgi:hypothetical protein